MKFKHIEKNFGTNCKLKEMLYDTYSSLKMGKIFLIELDRLLEELEKFNVNNLKEKLSSQCNQKYYLKFFPIYSELKLAHYFCKEGYQVEFLLERDYGVPSPDMKIIDKKGNISYIEVTRLEDENLFRDLKSFLKDKPFIVDIVLGEEYLEPLKSYKEKKEREEKIEKIVEEFKKRLNEIDNIKSSEEVFKIKNVEFLVNRKNIKHGFIGTIYLGGELDIDKMKSILEYKIITKFNKKERGIPYFRKEGSYYIAIEINYFGVSNEMMVEEVFEMGLLKDLNNKLKDKLDGVIIYFPGDPKPLWFKFGLKN